LIGGERERSHKKTVAVHLYTFFFHNKRYVFFGSCRHDCVTVHWVVLAIVLCMLSSSSSSSSLLLLVWDSCGSRINSSNIFQREGGERKSHLSHSFSFLFWFFNRSGTPSTRNKRSRREGQLALKAKRVPIYMYRFVLIQREEQTQNEIPNIKAILQSLI
jgi:hypothetical protein